MLNEQQLASKLEQCPAPRVTKEQIESRIKDTTFIRVGQTLTLCLITLDNGFQVRGESACVSPENYNKEIGETIAQKEAFNKLWPLFGFALAEQLHEKKLQTGGYDSAPAPTATSGQEDPAGDQPGDEPKEQAA